MVHSMLIQAYLYKENAMSTKGINRVWQSIVALLVLILIVAPVGAAPVRYEFQDAQSKISDEVLEATEGGESTSFIIYLDDQADVSAAYSIEDQDARGWYVYNTLTQHAANTQGPVIEMLEANGAAYKSFWVANVIMTEGDRELVNAVAARSDVRAVESDEATDWIQDDDLIDEPDVEDEIDSTDEVLFTTPGVNNVQAPQLWDLGYTGEGIVIANQDTGMRWTHNAIRTKYRGWGGSIETSDHNYSWWDAIHFQLPGSSVNTRCGYNSMVPCDDHGHGTHTTGTVVGDGGPGTTNQPNQVGVAPGAQWIGCRNMDGGNGRPYTYSECFQFFIAPTDLNGENPDPPKRPHVMNNSWGCPPSEECAANTLYTIVENTQAAGIFVVVSAGNAGPACSTVNDPPAIYGASFSVGAINGNTNALTSFSSRGPVTVDGSGRMKPEIVAPGQSVRSATRSSDTAYSNSSGTSMAGPHVVGTVALLWSARPHLVRDIEATKQLLTSTANPAVTVPNNASGCGGIDTIPNNHFGYGRVDVLAAYNADVARDQFITFDPITDKIIGEVFSPGATASSGLPVSYSAMGNCEIVGDMVHVTDVGSCTVTASQPGDEYYYAAADVSQTFSSYYVADGYCLYDPGHAILPPIKADGSSVFRVNSTIPAKFRVCDANGNSVGMEGVVTSFVQLSESGPVAPLSTPPSPIFAGRIVIKIGSST
jgi:serine protease AprX